MQQFAHWKQVITTKCYEAARFIRFVITHFLEDDCPYRASALAFTSLLAIVPLMTVGFAVLSSFPVFQDLSNPIQDFIFGNFVPATGKVVQTYLVQFETQVSRLSIWGIAFLFVTAILLMVTIERAMNKIWRVNTARHGVSAFLLYWAILSLGPVFLGLSLAASSYLLSMPLFQNNHAPSLLLSALPFLLSLIGFSFLYIVVPNRPVGILHGIIGGFISTVLFEWAKQVFAFSLSRYNSYELLYGAFAIVPIFFIWIYWVWLITLLGAEVSYALSVHHKRRTGYPLDGFSHALLWLQQLWIQQQSGKGLSLDALINSSNQAFATDSDYMINLLKELNLIHSSDDGELLLSKDLSRLTLYALSQQLPFSLPNQEQLQAENLDIPPQWQALFVNNDQQLQQSFNMSLDRFFEL